MNLLCSHFSCQNGWIHHGIAGYVLANGMDNTLEEEKGYVFVRGEMSGDGCEVVIFGMSGAIRVVFDSMLWMIWSVNCR